MYHVLCFDYISLHQFHISLFELKGLVNGAIYLKFTNPIYANPIAGHFSALNEVGVNGVGEFEVNSLGKS